MESGTPKTAGDGPLAAQYKGGSKASTMSARNQSVKNRLVFDMRVLSFLLYMLEHGSPARAVIPLMLIVQTKNA